jgi:hypothetical protein
LSPHDLNPPTDRASRAEERERLVAEVAAMAETKDVQFQRLPPGPARRGRWKIPVALVILLLAVTVAAFPSLWLGGESDPSPTAEELQRGLRAALYLQAEQVEVFRMREGRLPRSLDEVPVRIPGIRFVRSNNGVYQLVGFPTDGEPVVYDSARPTGEFDAIATGWLEGPG